MTRMSGRIFQQPRRKDLAVHPGMTMSVSRTSIEPSQPSPREALPAVSGCEEGVSCAIEHSSRANS
jgi:hypothetical protein